MFLFPFYVLVPTCLIPRQSFPNLTQSPQFPRNRFCVLDGKHVRWQEQFFEIKGMRFEAKNALPTFYSHFKLKTDQRAKGAKLAPRGMNRF